MASKGLHPFGGMNPSSRPNRLKVSMAVSAIALFVFAGLGPLAGQEATKVLFEDDFQSGAAKWEPTDSQSWDWLQEGENRTYAINKRISAYEPKYRSPHNISLVRDLSVGNVRIEFRVRSTKDTGNHRDCCVFFGYQDPEHFYYVH